MPPAAPSSAVSPSHNSLEPLDPNQPALPRQPNPHSNRGTPARPISAVSSLGGFRTPAAERAAPSLKRPASETLIARAAGASRCDGERAVPVFEVARYRCLSRDHTGVVAVVDNCASHPTEHRLNDIQK